MFLFGFGVLTLALGLVQAWIFLYLASTNASVAIVWGLVALWLYIRHRIKEHRRRAQRAKSALIMDAFATEERKFWDSYERYKMDLQLEAFEAGQTGALPPSSEEPPGGWPEL